MSTAFQGNAFQGDAFQIGAPQTGGGGITGDLSVTLGAVTVSSAAALAIQGAASITLGAITASSAGALAIKANASITLAAITLSSASALAIQAAASNTLGAVTLASTGALALKADASITLDAVTLSAAGAAVAGINGDAAITLGAVTVSSDATLTTVSTARPDGGGGRSKAVKESRRAQYQKRNDQIMLQWRNAELEQTTRTKADEVVALPRKAVEAAIQSLPVADHPMARAIAGTLPAVVQVAYAPGMVPPDQSQLVRALTVLLQREIARQQAEADEEDDIEMLLLAAA